MKTVITLALVCLLSGCSNFWSTMREETYRNEPREEFKTCYAVGSHVRRLPEECTGDKRPPRVREH